MTTHTLTPMMRWKIIHNQFDWGFSCKRACFVACKSLFFAHFRAYFNARKPNGIHEIRPFSRNATCLQTKTMIGWRDISFWLIIGYTVPLNTQPELKLFWISMISILDVCVLLLFGSNESSGSLLRGVRCVSNGNSFDEFYFGSN